MQHGLQVRETDVLIDDQSFDLVKHRRVGHVGIAAIDTSRRDHPQRRHRIAHRADLNRRRMRAQELAVRKEERVVHRARRMIQRNVERVEVVEIVFDFRPFATRKPAARKSASARERARHRMQAAER